MWRSWFNRDGVDQYRLHGEKTTQNQLIAALCTPLHKESDSKAMQGLGLALPHILQKEAHCDEVYPRIYIGDVVTATNKVYLKALGITHVLNAAEGKDYGFVDTDKYFYLDTTIKYLGLPLADSYTTNISRYFYTAAEFIDEAVSTGGKVLVHCMAGVSRSTTCVLAYLMIKKGMPAVDAIHTVRRNRFVRPNNGFLQQLAQLDNQLRGIQR